MHVLRDYIIYPAGDYALTISFGNTIDRTVNQVVLSLRNAMLTGSPWFLDIIPSYSSCTIIYDPATIRKRNEGLAFEWAKQEVIRIMESLPEPAEEKNRKVTIPVCYDPSVAPDIRRLAAERKIRMEEVIELHSRQTYCVYLLGFLPGFAYMGTVDDRIAAPRLAKPRTRVPAGSVGIAGNQTGIYPLESPGGWNLIGKTPVRLFDSTLSDPVFFRPGDKVKFQVISLEELDSFNLQSVQLITQ